MSDDTKYTYPDPIEDNARWCKEERQFVDILLEEMDDDERKEAEKLRKNADMKNSFMSAVLPAEKK